MQIEKNVLKKHRVIKSSILNEIDEKSSKILQILAIGDRKIDNAIKKSGINRFEAKKIIKNLIDKNILIKEYSREEPIKKIHPKQKIKKSLKRYHISHKIKFKNPFFRFWFRYIQPNIKDIKEENFQKILKNIEEDFENFISFIFEELSNELIKERFNDILSTGSYWDKKVELDILTFFEGGKVLVGECKWKNSKICKKTLTSLQKKCKVANIDVDIFALFSKSGFSNGLLKKKDKNLLLFDLEDLKEWSTKKSPYRKKEKLPYSFEF